MKKVVVFVTVVVLIVCLQGTGLAAGQALNPNIIISPMLTYINNANCNLDISSGTASMSSSIASVSSMDRLRMVEYLQKNDGGWVNIKSYSQNFYDTDHGYWSGTYTVSAGFQYRLYSYYYAYSGNAVIESTTSISYDTY